jgi:hypothetical protein
LTANEHDDTGHHFATINNNVTFDSLNGATFNNSSIEYVAPVPHEAVLSDTYTIACDFSIAMSPSVDMVLLSSHVNTDIYFQLLYTPAHKLKYLYKNGQTGLVDTLLFDTVVPIDQVTRCYITLENETLTVTHMNMSTGDTTVEQHVVANPQPPASGQTLDQTVHFQIGSGPGASGLIGTLSNVTLVTGQTLLPAQCDICSTRTTSRDKQTPVQPPCDDVLLHLQSTSGELIDLSTPAESIVVSGDASYTGTQQLFGQDTIQLDGVTDHLTVPDLADMSLAGDFTVEFHMYKQAHAPNNLNGVTQLIGKHMTSSASASQFLCTINGDNKLVFKLYGAQTEMVFTTIEMSRWMVGVTSNCGRTTMEHQQRHVEHRGSVQLLNLT